MTIETKATVTYSLTAEESATLRKAVKILELLEDNYKTVFPAYDDLNDNIMKISTGETFNLNNLIIELRSVLEADEEDTTILR